MTAATRVLQWARRKIRAALGGMCHFATPVLTDPIDYPFPNKFLNQMGVIITERSPYVIQSLLKNIEQQMGRRDSDVKNGKVVLDIDVLSVDDEVLRPVDMQRPYVHKGILEMTPWLTLAQQSS